MTPAHPQPDEYWHRALRPLPVRIAPLPRELLISFLRRLAHANHTDTGLLVRHLAGDFYPGMQQLRTHDLVLNRAARQRLAILAGYQEPQLRAVLATRHHYRDDDAQPARYWDPISARISVVMRPCTLCAARRGARIPALVRLGHDELPVCVQHRRTLVSFRDEQPRRGRPLGPLGPPAEQPLDTTPEILTAVRRHRALRRRRRDTVDAALEAAGHLTSGWRSWPRRRGESDAITARWRERSELLPRVVDQVIRFPETIALAAMFARHPQLLNTPRAGTSDPTPMVFLLHAARCLEHPEPEQLLRRHHPLFRWAGADDLPSWRWQNSSEPDRSIHAALRAGTIESLATVTTMPHPRRPIEVP